VGNPVGVGAGVRGLLMTLGGSHQPQTATRFENSPCVREGEPVRLRRRPPPLMHRQGGPRL
jgi:hypothetical protein